MKRIIFIIIAIILSVGINNVYAREENKMPKTVEIKITVGDKVLQAALLDNATTRALVKRFPLTLEMMDLYGREMCYRFPDALPAREAGASGYEVGDIAYWTPRHSFVIFYKQNGEIISDLQKVGHIQSGAELFAHTGDAKVTFELANQ